MNINVACCQRSLLFLLLWVVKATTLSYRLSLQLNTYSVPYNEHITTTLLRLIIIEDLKVGKTEEEQK
jgi:hypothetical protein